MCKNFLKFMLSSSVACLFSDYFVILALVYYHHSYCFVEQPLCDLLYRLLRQTDLRVDCIAFMGGKK